jgi:UDP-GlcNAc:undecaprenyl-phosphate GlcNAc-1-phosphate transferase
MPILDMSMAILRRLLRRQSVMKADKQHFHHTLNRRFHNQRIVVLILAACQLVFAGIGVGIYLTEWFAVGWILLGCIAVAATFYTLATVRRMREAEDAEPAVAPAQAPAALPVKKPVE